MEILGIEREVSAWVGNRLLTEIGWSQLRDGKD